MTTPERRAAGVEISPIVAIYVSPATRLAMRSQTSAQLTSGRGISGDRYENSRHRHVSIFATGELAAASAELGVTIDPALTRRNILVDTDRLKPEIGDELELGAARLQVVRGAHPCKLLDDTIGRGARTALRRRGGIICRVLEGAEITIGDLLRPADCAEPC